MICLTNVVYDDILESQMTSTPPLSLYDAIIGYIFYLVNVKQSLWRINRSSTNYIFSVLLIKNDINRRFPTK